MSTEWATNSAKFGWSVDGIFPSGTDGTHINHVAFSNDRTLIATADDYGLVNLFRNPCRVGHKPVSLRGHSEHVVRVAFNSDGSYLFSVGDSDAVEKTLKISLKDQRREILKFYIFFV